VDWRLEAGGGEPGADRVGAKGDLRSAERSPEPTNRATTGASWPAYVLSLDEVGEGEEAAGVGDALLPPLLSPLDAGVLEAEVGVALLSVLAAPVFSLSAAAFSFSSPPAPFLA
jgi:hypothetical protein